MIICSVLGGSLTCLSGSLLLTLLTIYTVISIPFGTVICCLMSPLLCASCTSMPLGIIGGSFPELIDSCIIVFTLPCFFFEYMSSTMGAITQTAGVCIDSFNQISKLPKAGEDFMKSFESEWSNFVYFCEPTMDYCSDLCHSLFHLIPCVLIYDFFFG